MTLPSIGFTVYVSRGQEQIGNQSEQIVVRRRRG
jgi:hypothetical protein